MDQREYALSNAISLASINDGMAKADAPHSAYEVASNAEIFLSFLTGTFKNTLAGTAAPEGTPPKATRQKKAAPADKATEAATSAEPATAATGAAAADDLGFGDDAPEKDPAKTEPKKEKAKVLTLDDVRAALVAAQTALKSKDKAVALLTEVAGAPVLSKLKEEDFGKLIDKCNAAVKAAS